MGSGGAPLRVQWLSMAGGHGGPCMWFCTRMRLRNDTDDLTSCMHADSRQAGTQPVAVVRITDLVGLVRHSLAQAAPCCPPWCLRCNGHDELLGSDTASRQQQLCSKRSCIAADFSAHRAWDSTRSKQNNGRIGERLGRPAGDPARQQRQGGITLGHTAASYVCMWRALLGARNSAPHARVHMAHGLGVDALLTSSAWLSVAAHALGLLHRLPKRCGASMPGFNSPTPRSEIRQRFHHASQLCPCVSASHHLSFQAATNRVIGVVSQCGVVRWSLSSFGGHLIIGVSWGRCLDGRCVFSCGVAGGSGPIAQPPSVWCIGHQRVFDAVV